MYFLISLLDKGNIRIRPLPGQKFPDGSKVNDVFNVSCDKEIRAKYPVGTIFCCEELEDKAKFYSVVGMNIYVVESATPITTTQLEGSVDAYHRFKRGEAFSDLPKSEGISDPGVTEDEGEKVDRPSTTLEKIMRKKELAPPNIEEHGFYVDKDIWYLLLRNLRRRENTLLIGPTGSGKTEIVNYLAEKGNKTLSIYDMGAMHDPMTGLLGCHRIGESGFSEFDYSKFSQDVAKAGIILLDELSRAPQSANNILLPCLDSRRTLPIEIASSRGVRNVPVHEDVCFFSTANMGSEYSGTNLMDRALLDRFLPVELEYLPKEIESKVLVARTGVDKRSADMISDVALRVRELWKRGEVSVAISTRYTLEAADLVKDGFGLLKSLELVFLPLFEGTKSLGERATVSAILVGK